MEMINLLEEHPKTTIVIKQWLLDKLLSSIDDSKVPDDFKEFARQQSMETTHVAGILQNTPRSMFDVFDNHKVYIDISCLNDKFLWGINDDMNNNVYETRKDADGAAVIESGSLDSAGVRVGTIDFDRLMKLVEDDLKVGTASNGSLLAGGILYPNQHSITLLPIGSVQIWNDLMEQLNGKFISLSQTRFNELVAKVPLLLK